jgi:DNA-binding NtrC family response regulator
MRGTTMRKVILTMEENEKYLTIKKLVETGGNKKRAALYLNCTARQINRMIKGYKLQGTGIKNRFLLFSIKQIKHSSFR